MYENGVLKLDNLIFYNTVRDPSKEVMVFFYTSSCDLCCRFMSVYEQVATELKPHKNLILSKIGKFMQSYIQLFLY